MNLHIFTTGGTIDKVYFDASSQFQVGEPVIPYILKEAGVHFPVTITSLMQKDSLEMDEPDRQQIHDAVAASDSSHILITHGTDTMVETGCRLLGIPGKTIVLTGSLAPARFQESDAPFNIGCAIAALQTLPEGVYITMNGQVFRTDQVRKNRELQRFEAL